PALEACLVQDSAHVLEGARGAHVGKIQLALTILDGALIDAAEVAGALYGHSTAAAVLNYKRARAIINYSYQQQADNIVGKMTIPALDRELAARDARPRHRGCTDPVYGGGGRRSLVAAAGGAGREGTPQLPATLSVLFQLVRAGGQLGPHA